MISSLIPNYNIETALNLLYDAYIIYVKRNYLYKNGDRIRVEKFTN